jgi:hypothetical protein
MVCTGFITLYDWLPPLYRCGTVNMPEQIKAIIFRTCVECPFSCKCMDEKENVTMGCSIAKNHNWWWSQWSSADHTRDIENPIDIPDWCPLPDITEAVEDLDSDCDFKPYW